VEVALALAVVTIAIGALLGMFPIGAQINHRSIFETRAGHLAHMMFTELRTPPFDGANKQVFGKQINLLNDNSTGETFYAEYDSFQGGASAQGAASSTPAITPELTRNSVYKIELSFDNKPTVPGVAVGTAGVANEITLRIYPLTAESEAIRFSTVIGNF
jgi:hypothetical protein